MSVTPKSCCQTGFTKKDANLTALELKNGNFCKIRSGCAVIGNLTVDNLTANNINVTEDLEGGDSYSVFQLNQTTPFTGEVVLLQIPNTPPTLLGAIGGPPAAPLLALNGTNDGTNYTIVATGATANGNGVQVSQAGLYEVHAALTLISSTATGTIIMDLRFADGTNTAYPGSSLAETPLLNAGGVWETITLFGILNLAAGDIVAVQATISGGDGTEDFSTRQFQLTINRLP